MNEDATNDQALPAACQANLGNQETGPAAMPPIEETPELAEVMTELEELHRAAEVLATGAIDAPPLPHDRLEQVLEKIRQWLGQLETTRQRAEQLALLNHINLALGATPSLEGLIRTLYEHLKEITTVDIFYIALYDPDADLVFFPVYTDGERYESYSFGDMRRRSVRRRPGFTGYILKTGQTLYVPDTMDPQADMPLPPVRFGGKPARTYLGVPLRLHGQVTGTISIQCYQPDAYTQDIIQLLEAIAAQIVFAVENARLLEQARLRAEEAETLRQASTAIVESLDTSKAIERILNQLQRVVPYDSASVQLLRGDEMEIVGGRGFEDMQNILGIRFPINADTPSGRVVAARKALYTNDAKADFPHFLEPPHHKIRSWMGVPLLFQDQLIGMLTLDGYQRDRFTAEHLRAVVAFADQVATALKNALLFEEIQRQAITDPLTGIPNRRRLTEIAEAEVERALRYRRPLSLLMVDGDHFKSINDTYGHITGDEVIKFLSHCLAETLPRKSDLVGRMGGEEFAILLPETDLRGAMRLAERIRRSIEAAQVPTHQGLLCITVSVGAAFFEPGEVTTWQELYRRADRALYLAKDRGRNRCAAYTPEV